VTQLKDNIDTEKKKNYLMLVSKDIGQKINVLETGVCWSHHQNVGQHCDRNSKQMV
jgi:hypothetical protein